VRRGRIASFSLGGCKAFLEYGFLSWAVGDEVWQLV